jgi:hypothetical protein
MKIKIYIVTWEYDSIIERAFIHKCQAVDYLRSKGLKCFMKTFWCEKKSDITDNCTYSIEETYLYTKGEK